jgi:hypothetical protein
MDNLLQKRLWPIILYPRYCLDRGGNTLGKYTPGTSQWPLQNISVSLWWFVTSEKLQGGKPGRVEAAGCSETPELWMSNLWVTHAKKGDISRKRRDYDVYNYPLNICFASNVRHLKTFFNTLNNRDLALPRWHKDSEDLWMFYTCLLGDARGWGNSTDQLSLWLVIHSNIILRVDGAFFRLR